MQGDAKGDVYLDNEKSLSKLQCLRNIKIINDDIRTLKHIIFLHHLGMD